MIIDLLLHLVNNLSFLFIPLDYPDYNSRIYSNYGAEVKYEDGEEQKYRPQVSWFFIFFLSQNFIPKMVFNRMFRIIRRKIMVNMDITTMIMMTEDTNYKLLAK